jgi:hypothetical protein
MSTDATPWVAAAYVVPVLCVLAYVFFIRSRFGRKD